MTSISASSPAVAAWNHFTEHWFASVVVFLAARWPIPKSWIDFEMPSFFVNIVTVFQSAVDGISRSFSSWRFWNNSSNIFLAFTHSTSVLRSTRASIWDTNSPLLFNWTWNSSLVLLSCSCAWIVWFSASAINSCSFSRRVKTNDLTVSSICSLMVWNRYLSKRDFSSNSWMQQEIVSNDPFAESRLQAMLLFTSFTAVAVVFSWRLA